MKLIVRKKILKKQKKSLNKRKPAAAARNKASQGEDGTFVKPKVRNVYYMWCQLNTTFLDVWSLSIIHY